MKVLMLLLFCLPLVYGETRVYEGVARFEGVPVYHEHHTYELEGSRPLHSSILYTDLKGKLIGKLDADFTLSVALPLYLMQDIRGGELSGMRYDKGRMTLFKKSRGQLEERRLIDDSEKELLLTEPGLTAYLMVHMDELLEKGEVEFKYLIPSRLYFKSLKMKVIAADADQAEIEVTLGHWLLNIFSSRLKYIYDVRKKAVKSFEGISNLRDIHGQPMSIDIQYSLID